ncbi:MAG: OFA family MFS transporter [Defluviitaleaceae bacterium]|nr:OFA family MFS transporter [Defluviitaleaceae bacterium]MCL2837067.1 OFA family MFS transporter [Defluviitaleaceae bacterium]
MEIGEQRKKAVTVLAAGVLFNLSIGVLYSWSMIKMKLAAAAESGGWGWNSVQAGRPYTVAIVCFALGVLIGGRIQDKIGPRRVVTAGGAMVGLGMVLSGIVGNSAVGVTLCFGVLTGLGIGIGYSSVTPPALKWFHPGRKGMVSGFIVGGFGLGAVYYAPLATALLNRYGIESTFIYMGIAVMIISTAVAQLVKNPPSGYTPGTPAKLKKSAAKPAAKDMNWREMMRTKRFCLMMIIFLLASSCGLMILGNVSEIARLQAGISEETILALLVSFMAVTNFAGRIGGGLLSDKIGRLNALFLIFVIQMLNMAAFMFYQNLPLIIIGIIGAGFCFGSILSIFPALTADQFGLKNYGQNYGIVYLAWGLSGVVAPVIADYFYDAAGNFNTAYIICAVMMVFIIGVNYLLKREIGK